LVPGNFGEGALMAVLQALRGQNPGSLYPLEGPSIVLGRHPGCDIVLDSDAVSRQHARIVSLDGRFQIEDLHSRNGTMLNGRLVNGRQPLVDSDELGICDLAFVFHENVPLPTEVSRRRELTAAEAMMVDDERPSSGSTIMSKLTVGADSCGMRLEVNSEAKLKALIEIGQSLGKALSLAEVLPKLLDSLFAIFLQADRGFIVLRDGRSGRLVPKAVKHRRLDDLETVRVSRTIVNNVMKTKEAILSADAATDARFDMAESIVDFQIRSMICAPLIASDGEALGVIQLDTLDRRNRFRQGDLDMLASVAAQAAIAVENAQLHENAMRDEGLQRELVLAHEVQRGFLPAGAPNIPEYDFFDFYEPANQLGGDYYDYIELPGGRLGIVVADVSGKGISASLLMAKLSAETRYCLAAETEPSRAMARMNRLFCESVWDDRFVTMVIAILDPRRHEVSLFNAGHLPPLWHRGPGVVEQVAHAETGLPLGVDCQAVYVPHLMSLAPGDSLVMYTDGITEAMNATDELYGAERLVSLLGTDVSSAEPLGRCILDDVKRFVGARAQSDDMCLTCFGRVKAE
jgi:phosphoserine phosphatase RsbU/P